MTVRGIPLRALHEVWPALWPLLEPAVKRSTDDPRPDVLADLIAARAQLWAIYENGKPVAAVVTRIQNDGEKRCLLWLIGGGRVREWAADFLARCEAWARSIDCVALYGAGRKGWARIVKKFGGESIEPINGSSAWRLVI
jgi:hypothetical protein